MPSATAGNNPVQCTTPDLGNGSHTEAMKQVLGVIDKKVRNMEKKKVNGHFDALFLKPENILTLFM